jgi:hypothetical protein
MPSLFTVLITADLVLGVVYVVVLRKSRAKGRT